VLAPAIGGVLTQLVKGIGPLLMPLAKIIGITIDALSPFLDIITLVVTEVANQLVPVFEKLGPVVADLAPVILELVVALLPLIPALAQILIAGITLAAMLSKVLVPILSFLIKVGIAPAIQVIGIAFEFLAEAVRQFAVFMMQAPWGKIFGAIGDGIKKLGAEAIAFFTGLFAGFVRLKNEAVAAFNRLWTAARDAIVKLIREAIALPGAFRRALGNLGTLLVEKGKDLIRGLWNGIIAMGGWLRDKVNGFVQNYLVGPLKSFLGISSPSKLMADEVGKWIPPGIVEGTQDAAGPLTTMINGLIGGGDAGGGATSGMGGGGFNFGPGSIIIQFSGVIPTATEAMGVGEAVGQGIARSISRRNTAAAIRMM
jgi:phage-related protein